MLIYSHSGWRETGGASMEGVEVSVLEEKVICEWVAGW